MMNEHIVYLALGSNLGNRAANLKEAVASLPPQMEVRAKSKVYETPPWGYTEQDNFLNQVLKVKTYLEPEPLLKHIKRLEIALGRKSSFRYGPRLIDMDILFYDELVLESATLTIPHPRVHERGFVLLPLLDIAPEFVHPVKQMNVRDMLAGCDLRGITQIEK
jgi:2-amino-4-hydroxy-6-hydroxymethyldihydropteridine diphosphokinase